MAEDEPQDHPSDDAAAEAFEALRAEVAQLRASLERPAPPDYSPTLAVISRSLAAVEEHPALQLTPQDLAAQTRQAVDAAQQQGRRELSNAVQLVNAAAAEMQGLVQSARAGRDQDSWLAIAGGAGLLVGIMLWACFSGPIARSLPARWSVPEKMAAATLRLDRWDAGARLMQSASPQGWAQMAAASDLVHSNTAALEDCRKAGVRTGMAHRCVIVVPTNSPTIGR